MLGKNWYTGDNISILFEPDYLFQRRYIGFFIRNSINSLD